MFSCKSEPVILVAHFIIYYYIFDIVHAPCTCLTYYMYVYISVRYSLLDYTECRDHVYCIAHTMSTRSILSVVIQHAGIYLQHYSQYILYSALSGFHTT